MELSSVLNSRITLVQPDSSLLLVGGRKEGRTDGHDYFNNCSPIYF